MRRGSSLFAAFAMIPGLCGPIIGRAAVIEVALCEGGTIQLPLREQPAPPATEPCCAKGCHLQRKRAAPEPAN